MKNTVTYPLSAITGEDEMSDTPRTDKFAQKFLLTWNQFAYRSDEDIAKQFQNTDDALDLARQLERELAEAVAAERERCAKVCEEMANSRYLLNDERQVAHSCAEAIRKGE
jgi:hypothetical protein